MRIVSVSARIKQPSPEASLVMYLISKIAIWGFIRRTDRETEEWEKRD